MMRDGRLFVQVGDAMVNVDMIEAYKARRYNAGTTDRPKVRHTLMVTAGGLVYEEHECTVEEFSTRLMQALGAGLPEEPDQCESVHEWARDGEPASDRYTTRCTKDAGHAGRHGYAGMFWDD